MNKTIVFTQKEMLDLYFECKRLIDLLRKHRKSGDLIFEELDFQTIGQFCVALGLTSEKCSKVLSAFRLPLSKYDMVIRTEEENN